MKTIFRNFCVGVFLIFAWPFFLYKKYGNTKIKLDSATIIISNHYSTFDPLFVYLSFKKYPITFITISETKKKLLSRFVTWIFDCLFIYKDSINIKMIKESIDVLKHDGIICIYPEGFINPRKYGFFDFHKSYLLMAEKAKANILPIYTYPELKVFKKSKIYIGELITYNEYMKYTDLEARNMYFQSLIMDYSCEFDNDQDKELV